MTNVFGRTLFRVWHDHPFDALFLLLVAMVFAGPLSATGVSWVVSVVAALMPLAAVVSLGRGQRAIRAGLFLGLPAMVAIVQDDLGADLVPEWVAMTFPLAVYIFVTVIIVRRVLDEPGPSRNSLLAAVSGYLMLGYVWSIACRVLQALDPDAFSGAMGSEGVFDTGAAIYYSFVTLTTMGYGDIVPVSPLARSLAVLEAVTGLMYLAVLVAAVVGGIGSRSRPAGGA